MQQSFLQHFHVSHTFFSGHRYHTFWSRWNLLWLSTSGTILKDSFFVRRRVSERIFVNLSCFGRSVLFWEKGLFDVKHSGSYYLELWLNMALSYVSSRQIGKGVPSPLLHKGSLIISDVRLRPYHVEYTSSRPITEVKQRRARLVLGWVTAWEYRVS